MLVPASKPPPSAGVGTSTLGECAAPSSFSVKLRNSSITQQPKMSAGKLTAADWDDAPGMWRNSRERGCFSGG